MSNGFQIEENKSQGFIKIHRSFMGWEWYDDAHTMRVFIHLLLRANHKAKKWHGQIIERGSFISSYAIIADELSISIRNLRTALKHLVKTEEIKIDGYRGLYSLFIINNYDAYQENDKAKSNNNDGSGENADNETTNNSQNNDIEETKDGQNPDNKATTNKNEKNIKNDKNKKNNFIAKSFFQKLFTDDSEYQKNNSHLKDLFIEFLEYKTAIKKQFKTESGVENAFKDFIRLSENNAELGRALVDNSIARGWQSIYDLSAEQRKAFKNAQIKNQQMNDKNYGGF